MGPKKTAMLRAAQVSLGGNVILFVLKAAALLLVNSLAIATDLGITVVGLIVSVILYYSVNLSNRPADSLHNYGYGKIEHVCEALEGVVLIGIALVMSFQAVTHMLHPKEISLPWLGFAFSAAGATVNFIGASWILWLARCCSSPAVRAEGFHYQLEGFISLTVAGSFLLTALLARTALKPWTMYLDPAATLAVSLLISVPSYRLAKHAFFKLLDASLEEHGKIAVLRQLGKYVDLCCEFRDIRSRSSGRKNFVELKIVLPRTLTFEEASRLSGIIEKDLSTNIPACEASVRAIPCEEGCAFSADGAQCPYLSAGGGGISGKRTA